MFFFQLFHKTKHGEPFYDFYGTFARMCLSDIYQEKEVGLHKLIIRKVMLLLLELPRTSKTFHYFCLIYRMICLLHHPFWL